MTPTDDRSFPIALAAAMAEPFDYADGDGIDFEPFDAFLSAEETTDWFRAWTGNGDVDGDAFRVFGKDGSGGYAAFWLIRPEPAVADQPVVFLGSEGETGVIARDLGDFLWLLAAGLGPWEAATPYDSDRVPRPDVQLAAVAQRFAPDRRQSVATLVELAGREFPDFDDVVMELCR
ncbi:SMI1/KNR4 family protein [Streptomyces sp. NPDC002928]|uniref:SMI1/KNR4 family protein n=1 Tax=Streptomyces sp. NPDC002928 TaxID=3154440 RepID=UPI0033A72966